MKYKLADLVDLKRLDELLQKFTNATDVTTALLDTEGNVLCAAGWKDICTKFHRVHPETQCRCKESDTALAAKLAKGEKYNVYQCLNGMVDVAAPVFVENEHVGNLFIGQFFFEEPDVEFFRKQAFQYGFNEVEYLEALKKVPILTEERIEQTMGFLDNLTEMIGEMGLTQKKQLELYEEQRKSKEALRDSEERYRLLADNATDIIWTMDLEQQFTYVSPSVEKMFGYPPEEALQLSLKQILTAKSLDVASHVIMKELSRNSEVGENSDQSVTLVLEHVRKDGRTFWAEVTSTFLQDTGGTINGVLGITRDITDRKNAEEQLERSEALLSAAISQSPSGIVIADAPNVRIRYANSAAFNIRGESQELLTEIDVEEHSKSWKIFSTDGITPYPPQQLPLSRAILEGVVSENVELIMENDKGEKRWVSTNASPIYDKDGKITSGIVIFQDVTKRKLAEDAKARLEDQLRQSQKMEAIGRLAGGVAHDFNNILTGINGYSEMILAGLEDNNPLRLDIEEILKAGERASALTAQLLAFSRKQVIAPKVIQPNEILERSQKMLRRIIGEDVDLMFVPAHDLESIKADPAQLDQILVNLAVNARDAMPGGGKLTIETQNVNLEGEQVIIDGETIHMIGSYVLLAVTDNGHGMDEETCQKIFEPFFSTKEMGKGTGLGLATVYGIVRQNEGFITVYSEPGVGTTFKLYFPKADEKTPLQEAGNLNKLPRGDETILLVEDEDMVRTLARKILERQGYKVIDANDGEKAINKLNKEAGEIHLLLTDVILPHMNGRQVYETLQKNRPALKALFMSGYTENVIAHHGVLEEGTKFVQKPFTIDVLARKVREALDDE